MNWVTRKRLPKNKDERVLTYSPGHEKNHPMRYRIMDAKAVLISKEVTHWTSISSPEEDRLA